MIDATGANVAGSSIRVDPRCLPPAIIIERTLARVAGLTQGAEVIKVVGATVLKRENVVDFLCGRVPAGREAVFAERVGGDVGGADFTPARAVAGVDLRITLLLPIVCVFHLRVLLAETFVGELRATRMGARGRWFDRHRLLLPTGCGEAPRLPCVGSWGFSYFSTTYIIAGRKR